ncbi:MAG: phosphoribosylformylglycinamidine synthase subunit PurL [Bacteroidota bacterium]|nr:phosphoribosylformylglycinamidine synthase subunit PurL [Bacteroidota bacterium]MDP4228938.1 phosphoribosylformylglycinamidine synthase subunit PurL [Bacteroidota bacterium]MDP4236697.1 phosphoribosylformylglycinamidine synthase subunit PurL [Bacteroidota bacterium]
MTNTISTLAEAKKTALELGLLDEEFEKIVSILGGRIPTYTELGIFSVMWSEHCSYKNSITQLKTLPRKGKRLLVEAGEENAGLVDIGDGLAVAFKIESHNHPSAVEPYQGAATGVGGILRDIFTMGARPIAALNSLRFGSLSEERTKFLVRGVVHGIADYGNSFGVPTVAGEVYFDPCYQGNPLVNAMAVGIVKHGETVSASADGVGNIVMIVGSSTGRDGIHGASLLASAVFSEAAEELRPTVQVGDPFTEKLLLEATLEAIGKKLVVGMQDMGAAGISCSTSEMSAKAGTGMKIDLNKVPLREATMSSYEIMLSESQERMLVVVEPKNVDAIKEVFTKWDLQAEVIGTVTDTGTVEISYHGEVVANLPSKALALGGDMTPVYQRETREPSYLKETMGFDLNSISDIDDANAMLRSLIASPNIASKRWVYEQYDSMVRTNTLDLEGSDAAVIRVKGTTKGLAVKTDCNSRYVYLNPYRGAMIAVCEAARNIACTGAQPIAITNCLNFGNPYDPEVYYQFTEAIRGMGDACRTLETPVTGGNVSFYNESPSGAIYPTPTIGMLGVIDDIANVVSSGFKNDGDAILLLSAYEPDAEFEGLGGSEYLAIRTGGKAVGNAPNIDPGGEARLIDLLVTLAGKRMLKSAHDISEGGLAVTITESCFSNMIGARIMPPSSKRNDHSLFGEMQGRVVISVAPESVEEISMIVRSANVKLEVLGTTGGRSIIVDGLIDCDLDELYSLYTEAIPSAVEAVVEL